MNSDSGKNCSARGSRERSPEYDLLSEAMQMAGVPDVISPLRSQPEGGDAAIGNNNGAVTRRGLLEAYLENDERPLAPGVSFEMPILKPAGSQVGISNAPRGEGRAIPSNSKRASPEMEYDSDFEDPIPNKKRSTKSLSQSQSKSKSKMPTQQRKKTSGGPKSKGKRPAGDEAGSSSARPPAPVLKEYKLRRIDLENSTRSSRPSLPRNCESGKGASMLKAMLEDGNAAASQTADNATADGGCSTATLPVEPSTSTNVTGGTPIELSSDSESEFDVLSQREDRELVKRLKRKRIEFERERQAALERVRVGEASQAEFSNSLESVDADLRRSNADVERLEEELRRAKEERQRFQERRQHIVEGKERERITLERDRVTLARAEKKVRLLD